MNAAQRNTFSVHDIQIERARQTLRLGETKFSART
jgi:hypothetical protein